MAARLHPVALHVNAALKLPAGAHLLVSVSGGPDSLCLLHVLSTLAPRRGWTLHLFHLNHQLRGVAADDDAAYVQQIAATWGIPATIASADIAAEATTTGKNLHAIAREVRYRMLAELAATQRAFAVLVGHHADDQAETLLMHLVRGAGAAGLRGMRAVVPWNEWASVMGDANGPPLLRPLLAVRRAAIEAYCAAHGLAPRHDATNDDIEPMRNRIRHELLPLLHSYNPQIVAALGRTAAAMSDDYTAILATLDAAWAELAKSHPGGVVLQRNALVSLPIAVQHEAIRRAHRILSDATLSRERAEQVQRLIAATGATVELPGGVAVTMTHSGVHFGELQLPVAPQLADTRLYLSIPGKVNLADHGTLTTTLGIARPAASRWEIWLDAASLPAMLHVRARNAGDVVAIGTGHRRVQDIFTDAHVPRQQRKRWPLLWADDRIIWVVGLRVAAGAQAAVGQTNAVRIQFASPHVTHSNSVATPADHEGADGA